VRDGQNYRSLLQKRSIKETIFCVPTEWKLHSAWDGQNYRSLLQKRSIKETKLCVLTEWELHSVWDGQLGRLTFDHSPKVILNVILYVILKSFKRELHRITVVILKSQFLLKCDSSFRIKSWLLRITKVTWCNSLLRLLWITFELDFWEFHSGELDSGIGT